MMSAIICRYCGLGVVDAYSGSCGSCTKNNGVPIHYWGLENVIGTMEMVVKKLLWVFILGFYKLLFRNIDLVMPLFFLGETMKILFSNLGNHQFWGDPIWLAVIMTFLALVSPVLFVGFILRKRAKLKLIQGWKHNLTEKRKPLLITAGLVAVIYVVNFVFNAVTGKWVKFP
jgi:heme exporter protein D